MNSEILESTLISWRLALITKKSSANRNELIDLRGTAVEDFKERGRQRLGREEGRLLHAAQQQEL